MSDLIAVTGNLTTPPERRDLANGVVMATFGLACTERRFEGGKWTDAHTNFFDVAVYRRLAEHVLASLQRGQRVIVLGKLRIRRWESNGRAGTTVDLEASSIGPDLKFGVASFVRDTPTAVSSAGAAPSIDAIPPTDAWATPGQPQTALASQITAGDLGGTVDPSASSATVAPGSETGARSRESDLVAAGEWGDDPTPF